MDDLDLILTPRVHPFENVHRRDILIRSQSLVRWESKKRIWKQRSIVAIAFFFGLGVASINSNRELPESKEVATTPTEKSVEIAIYPKHVALSPADLELQAEQLDDPAVAAELYRKAGDRYLQEQQKYDHALRCYRQYLDRAGSKALEVTESDNWLLTSLKNSRWNQEKYHASKPIG
jgi:hypothetical protein